MSTSTTKNRYFFLYDFFFPLKKKFWKYLFKDIKFSESLRTIFFTDIWKKQIYINIKGGKHIFASNRY